MLPSFSLSLLLLSATAQFANAVGVYLVPTPAFASTTVSPDDALTTLSRHFGLEAFQPLLDTSNGEEHFVGKGLKSSLLLTMDSADMDAVLPPSLHQTFNIDTPSVESLDTVLSTYLHQAAHWFSSVYSSFQFGKANDVKDLVNFFENSESPSFAAIQLSELAEIRQTVGTSSDEYNVASEALRAFLERAVEDQSVQLAIMTLDDTASHFKRAAAPQQTQAPFPLPPHLPLSGLSTCHSSLDICNNSTSSCSGHGKCSKASKAGRTCFVCSCNSTKTGTGKAVKTTYWAGESCERQDISSTFLLFAGTVIVLLVLAVGSVSLLYTVGDQSLPSTLLATAVPAKRD